MPHKRTHFRATDKKLTEVPNLLPWRKHLLVVHLERNLIQRWRPEIGLLERLTHLYLEDNQITTTAEINNLPHVQKVLHCSLDDSEAEEDSKEGYSVLYFAWFERFLGRNSISVVEGFSQCWSLRHLEIQNQQLAVGDQLLFHPLTTTSLQDCVEFLNISGNHVDTLDDLTSFRQLETLVAENNALSDLNTFKVALRKWGRLKSASFRGNPIQFNREYRKAVVLASRSICVLDGKPIMDVHRQAIQAVHIRKERAVLGAVGTDGHQPSRLEGLPCSTHADNKGVVDVLCDAVHETRTQPLAIPDCIPRALWKVQNFACFFRQSNQRRRLRATSRHVTFQGPPQAASEAADEAQDCREDTAEGLSKEGPLQISKSSHVRQSFVPEVPVPETSSLLEAEAS